MFGVSNPRSRPMTPYQERLGRVTVQWMTGINNVAYRLSGGRVAGHVPSGAPICLLTTTGRRTKRRRTVPLLCLRDGADPDQNDGEGQQNDGQPERSQELSDTIKEHWRIWQFE